MPRPKGSLNKNGMRNLVRPKTCKKCLITKSPSEFYLRSKKRGGLDGRLQDVCKNCWGKRCKNYYGKNIERFRISSKRWALENPERLREIKNKSQNQIRLQMKFAVLEFYGGKPPKCACCSEKNILFLTIDHKNNDGNKHRRELSGGENRNSVNMYLWIVKNNFPPLFQVLCYNCNFGRAKTKNKICPHKLV